MNEELILFTITTEFLSGNSVGTERCFNFISHNTMGYIKQILSLFLLILAVNISFCQKKDNGKLVRDSVHLKKRFVILSDKDGDGITDQFDKEPETPKGCPVDMHGVSRDTDGDSIPDCKDKEPLTKKECMPVNSMGEGLCPEPACCKGGGIQDPIINRICNLNKLPDLKFKKNEFIPDSLTIITLDSVADAILKSPYCNVKIYSQYRVKNNQSKALAAKRAEMIIKYFVEQKTISESRFKTIILSGDEIDTVMLIASID